MTALRVFYFGREVRSDDEILNWGFLKLLSERFSKTSRKDAAPDLLFLDFSWKQIPQLLAETKSRKILVIFEPNAVNPLQHSPIIQRLFSLVIVTSKGQVQSSNTYVEGGGWNPARVLTEVKMKTQPMAVACAFGNKVSLAHTSAYSLRRDVLKSLVDKRIKVHLAGPGWLSKVSLVKGYIYNFTQLLLSFQLPDLSKFRPLGLGGLTKSSNFKYIGWVDDEIDFFSNYGCIVVVENDLKFLSEKLFHAIASGSKVVYCGPPGLPDLSSLGVVQCNPNPHQISMAVEHSLNSKFDPKLNAFEEEPLKTFFQLRSNESFYRRLAEKIGEHLDVE